MLTACFSPLTPKEVTGADMQMSVTADIWADYSHFVPRCNHIDEVWVDK